MSLNVEVARSVPRDTDVVGVPVASEGPVPRSLGLSRATLAAHGFEGKPGQILALPTATGPTLIAVGIGNPEGTDGRLAAQRRQRRWPAPPRSGPRWRRRWPISPRSTPGRPPRRVVEGVMLAAYRYVDFKADKSGASKLERVTLVVGAGRAVGRDRRGRTRTWPRPEPPVSLATWRTPRLPT